MNINEWFRTITNGESQRTVAQKINVQQSKLSRQLNAGHLDPELIRDITRAYGTKAGDALLATGFLSPDDLELIGVEEALRHATNSQILAELDRRLDPEARRLYRAEGVDDVVDLADDFDADAQVFDFPHVDVAPVGEDGVPLDAVADSSPEEEDGDPGAYEP